MKPMTSLSTNYRKSTLVSEVIVTVQPIIVWS